MPTTYSVLRPCQFCRYSVIQFYDPTPTVRTTCLLHAFMRYANKMPLPNVSSGKTRRCHAKAKSTGQQCRNPAAYEMLVCRFHGARKPETVRSGDAHPQYKHGQCTKAARAQYSRKSARLRDLENLAYEAGLIKSRTRGRKPRP